MNIAAGTPVLVGSDFVDAPELMPGDRLLAVHQTGDLLVIPDAQWRIAAEAVAGADAAFRALASVSDDAVTSFFRRFAELLDSDSVWSHIAAANAEDMQDAAARGRTTGRLEATAKMRSGMIDGLRGWAATPSRRGEVIERRETSTWTVERIRAPLGVVAFVFEGRPNVFADGAGVVRSGNASVMRIGSDALRTAKAINEHALSPAIHDAGLPAGAVTIVDSKAHSSAHALFCQAQVRLAIARGSGRSVALLGSIAQQHGIPASMHGTGGAWLYAAADADPQRVYAAIAASVDRKVCNTLNVALVHSSHERVAREVLAAAQATVHENADLGHEFEWETQPELHLRLVDSADAAAQLFNAHSPRFVASILTDDDAVRNAFYAAVDAPYVGDGFTRWVDGQWAWNRPELGLTNWEGGRLLGRSGILAGDDVFTVRDVFTDTTRAAPQHR